MKNKTINALFFCIFCNFVTAYFAPVAFAADNPGKWVWAFTGWGIQRNPKFPATGASTNVSPVIIDRYTDAITATVNTDVKVSRTTTDPFPSVIATVDFATSKIYYWKSPCGDPPPPFTDKVGRIGADGNGSLSYTITGSQHPNDADEGGANSEVNVESLLSYSDDYGVNGDKTYDKRSLPRSEVWDSTEETGAAKTLPIGGGLDLYIESRLRARVNYYSHYSVSSTSYAFRTDFAPFSSVYSTKANVDLTGSGAY